MIPGVKLLFALLSFVVLSACEDGPKTCPLFDHPGEAVWDPAVPGDVVVFQNQTGDEIPYRLVDTVDDNAAAVPARRNCVSYSISKYYDEGNKIGFDVTFKHTLPGDNGPVPLPIDQQFLEYRLQVVSGDTKIQDISTFALESLDSSFNNVKRGIGVYQYSPTRTINGIEYKDVLERDSSGYENLVALFADYPEDAAWVRVVVAKDPPKTKWHKGYRHRFRIYNIV